MFEIQLYFSGPVQFELFEVVFSHVAPPKRLRSVRGKFSMVPGVSGTFQWSPAVRALALLMLSLKLDLSTIEGLGTGSITGGANSPASSLDYALSKQPVWLTDMFGISPGGHATIRRIVNRTNPERRYPGPVTIGIDSKKLLPEGVSIFVDNVLASTQQIEAIARSIAGQSLFHRPLQKLGLHRGIQRGETSPHNLAGGPLEQQSTKKFQEPPKTNDSDDHWRELLHTPFTQEVLTSLSTPLPSSEQLLSSAFRTVIESSEVRETIMPLFNALKKSGIAPSSSARHGVTPDPRRIQDSFQQRGGLTVGIPAVHVGTIAIWEAVRDTHHLPIHLSYTFAHSTELAHFVCEVPSRERPDIFALNLATGSSLLPRITEAGYIPFLLAPAFTQRVQGLRGDRNRDSSLNGTYHLMSDIPTSASMYYQELAAAGCIQPNRSRIEERDLVDIAPLLEDPSSGHRIISPFPFYTLFERNGAEYLDTPEQLAQLGTRPTVLFVREDLREAPRFLSDLHALFRDSWLGLIETPELLQRTVTSILASQRYLTAILRMSGCRRSGCHSIGAPTVGVLASHRVPVVTEYQ